jgi:hypothetical protein
MKKIFIISLWLALVAPAMATTTQQNVWISRWKQSLHDCQSKDPDVSLPSCVANDVLTRHLMQSGCGYDSRKWNCLAHAQSSPGLSYGQIP